MLPKFKRWPVSHSKQLFTSVCCSVSTMPVGGLWTPLGLMSLHTHIENLVEGHSETFSFLLLIPGWSSTENSEPSWIYHNHIQYTVPQHELLDSCCSTCFVLPAVNCCEVSGCYVTTPLSKQIFSFCLLVTCFKLIRLVIRRLVFLLCTWWW